MSNHSSSLAHCKNLLQKAQERVRLYGHIYIYIYIYWLRDDLRNPPVTVVTKHDGESQKRDGEYPQGIPHGFLRVT